MKDKKDGFLIVRISTKQKVELLALAKKRKITLSTLIREIVTGFIDGK